ncbi:hypothetical protein [Magnetospira sp. QH-2]|uniref:hypothetical protein n=1 Tax=Magnetospira sp. (strain QH-2) TaxID=1288970 RepID=UPI0003E81424|nr:hypothetical protein [Magnetospira sp. QH-2]CCQ75476.1 protein of unknown function [Magnetospira sp. QH-2]
MLTDNDALKALATLDGSEASSSFWRDQEARYSVDVDGGVQGETVLGSYSAKTGLLHRLGHWVLQTPFRFMARRFRDRSRCERMGREIARRQGRAYTHDMQRQALSLSLIRHYQPSGTGQGVNLVIGDGYGVMTSLLLMDEPGRKTITVNLNKSLLLDLAMARRAHPDIRIALVSTREEMARALTDPGFGLIAVRADDCSIIDAASVALAVNIVSMQEMDPPVVEEYFRILRANPAGATRFYCANKLWKQLPDGTESKFEDYPWSGGDSIDLDEVCAWSQWVYSLRPPFWHYRKGKHRIIWHRLAQLEKAST